MRGGLSSGRPGGLSGGLTDEQRALQETVRSLLTRHATSAAVRTSLTEPRGFDEKLWHLLCGQVGVAGLSIPERYGGAGATLVETALVLEELGRPLAPSPMLGSGVLAAQGLLSAGNDEACARLLPGIADGSRVAALAWTGAAGDWGAPVVTAAKPPDGWRLDGQVHYVLDGNVADILLVAARSGDPGVAGGAFADHVALFEVEPSAARCEATPTMDPTRRLARVRLDGTPARRLGAPDLDRVRDIACAALAAEQVGAAARALELTVEHARTRVQFGQPIGTFQALKHRMADMHVLVETARSAAYAAAGDPGDYAAVAKVWCSEALQQVAAEMIQLHGGIAITAEHDAHLYFKRAHGSTRLFGAPGDHVARLSAQLTRL